MDNEDIFHNAILFTLNNRDKVGEDIEGYFVKKLRHLERQVAKDDRQTKIENDIYGKHIQAKKGRQ